MQNHSSLESKLFHKERIIYFISIQNIKKIVIHFNFVKCDSESDAMELKVWIALFFQSFCIAPWAWNFGFEEDGKRVQSNCWLILMMIDDPSSFWTISSSFQFDLNDRTETMPYSFWLIRFIR